MTFMRIFQLRDTILVEIPEDSFNLEKTIQTLVEKNLSSIFSGLEFIETEFQIDDLRPDTIAFDSEKKSCVNTDILQTSRKRQLKQF